jgi:hypothetical protein
VRQGVDRAGSCGNTARQVAHSARLTALSLSTSQACVCEARKDRRPSLPRVALRVVSGQPAVQRRHAVAQCATWRHCNAQREKRKVQLGGIATCNTQRATRSVTTQWCNTQRATRNTQRATRSVQHAACNTQRATRSVQHAACNTQHATCNTQRATRNVQRVTRNVQHATCNTQRATRNVQHATCRHNWRRHALRKRPDRYDGQGGLRPSAPARTYLRRIPTHGR